MLAVSMVLRSIRLDLQSLRAMRFRIHIIEALTTALDAQTKIVKTIILIVLM